MKKILILVLLLWVGNVYAQLVANAGGDRHFCTNPCVSINNLTIGGTPSAEGGTPPYTYTWSMQPKELYPGSDIILTASYLLDDTTISNPQIIDFTTFDSLNLILKVTDNLGNTSADTVTITFSSFAIMLSYVSYDISLGDSVFLNQGVNIQSLQENNSIVAYEWTPHDGLSNPYLKTGFWAKPDTSVSYSVTITDAFGCQVTAPPFYYITVSTLGLKNEQKNNVSIYPNPVKDYININNISKNIIKDVRLFSLNGKLIKNYGLKTHLDVKNIPKGMYIVTIITEKDQRMDKKVVIIK